MIKPEDLIEEIKSAVDNNEWSLRELNNLVDELAEFAANF